MNVSVVPLYTVTKGQRFRTENMIFEATLTVKNVREGACIPGLKVVSSPQGRKKMMGQIFNYLCMSDLVPLSPKGTWEQMEQEHIQGGWRWEE